MSSLMENTSCKSSLSSLTREAEEVEAVGSLDDEDVEGEGVGYSFCLMVRCSRTILLGDNIWQLIVSTAELMTLQTIAYMQHAV